MHPPAILTGGKVPAHAPGAYPRLSCCGGPKQLVLQSMADADWAKEHEETDGEHFDLSSLGTSAAQHCPLCRVNRHQLTQLVRDRLDDESAIVLAFSVEGLTQDNMPFGTIAYVRSASEDAFVVHGWRLGGAADGGIGILWSGTYTADLKTAMRDFERRSKLAWPENVNRPARPAPTVVR